jgi:hypothetical protein
MKQAGVAGNGVCVCADDRTGEPVSEQQKAGELSGAESERRKLGMPATVGCHQRTGQLDDALVAGGSSCTAGIRRTRALVENRAGILSMTKRVLRQIATLASRPQPVEGLR